MFELGVYLGVFAFKNISLFIYYEFYCFIDLKHKEQKTTKKSLDREPKPLLFNSTSVSIIFKYNNALCLYILLYKYYNNVLVDLFTLLYLKKSEVYEYILLYIEEVTESY